MSLRRKTLLIALSTLLAWPLVSPADTITQENFKTHLRWNVLVPREQVNINKSGNTVTLQTLNLPLYESLVGDVSKLPSQTSYIQKVTYSQEEFPSKPATIHITLKDESIELFSFYREPDRKYILDFWINTDHISAKTAGLQKPLPIPPEKSVQRIIRPAKKPIEPLVPTGQTSILKALEVPAVTTSKTNPDYRDFRYGASFVWDRQAMIPPLEKDIILGSKIPEYLYPIKNRTLLDDPKEAHVQLTINLYRQLKWGLMNKSLTLYEKKYGRDVNQDMNDFIKANALLKENLPIKNRGIIQSALNILSTIMERTQDADLKMACMRYLVQFAVDNEDWVQALQMGKRMFVDARARYDQEIVALASTVVLNSLAQLKQTEKIGEFLADKKLAAVLPPQTDLAYSSYSLLATAKENELIKRFEMVQKSLVKPIHPAILYNVSEAYFRNARYEDAIKTFDEFLASYAHLDKAADARIRLALAYEITDRPSAETLTLYRNAIDRSPYPAPRYEAKVRYVGMRLARKWKPDASDKESEVFLEQSPDETKALTNELKHLLWLTRLRVFINQGEYDKALSYLTSIPIETLKPAERRVFEGDGAEVVYGMIQAAYLKEDYARTVKLWEVYKNKYEQKVAHNPYMNFIVADAFIKLGLYSSFERAAQGLKTANNAPLREYPEWAPRTKVGDLSDMVIELEIIKAIASKEWDQAEAKLAQVPVSKRNPVNHSYYQGLVLFHKAKYSEAAGEFEKVLISPDPNNRLTPSQMGELLMSYVESLHNLRDPARFKVVVGALAQDIRQSKSAQVLNVSERVHYLLTEAVASEEEVKWKEVEEATQTFKKLFPKSPYISRIEYLLGLSLLRNGKINEGKVTLEKLIEQESAPGYIREMARTELSALNLKTKQL